MQDNNKIFIANIPWSITDSQLGEIFQEVGEVIKAEIIIDRETQRSRGFGFVTFTSPDSVNKAIESKNGYDIKGRKIIVAKAKPQTF